MTKVPYLIILFTIFSFFSHAQSTGQRRSGLEFEFAGAGPASDNSDVFNYFWFLDNVKRLFGGEDVSVDKWEKYSNAKGTVYGHMKDAQRRDWSLVPEIMENGFDGYELITPPLQSEGDYNNLEVLIGHLEKLKYFVKGKSSSTHYTYDVSDLIEGQNISKFVDLVLFLESHIVDIYYTVKPERYGRAVNNYAVPLAIDQKELLKELAALPKAERTYENVRNLFLKYDQRELEISGNNSVRAWKFRAINYGKFLKIGRFSFAPVVEFRIADLVGPSNLKPLDNFYRKLIEVGSNTPASEFKDPLPQFTFFDSNSAQHRQIDKILRTSSQKSYQNFLSTLGLKTEDLSLIPKGFSVSQCKNIFI